MIELKLFRFRRSILHSRSGTDNWGLIGYDPTELVDDNIPDAGTNQVLLSGVPSKISSQWIGSLVTPEWWSYVWLDDGLVNYIQYIVLAEVSSEYV